MSSYVLPDMHNISKQSKNIHVLEGSKIHHIEKYFKEIKTKSQHNSLCMQSIKEKADRARNRREVGCKEQRTGEWGS